MFRKLNHQDSIQKPLENIFIFLYEYEATLNIRLIINCYLLTQMITLTQTINTNDKVFVVLVVSSINIANQNTYVLKLKIILFNSIVD